MTESTEHQSTLSSDEISLGDVADRLWRQRVPILLSVVGATGLGGLILAWLLAVTPSTESAQLPFRIKFSGATVGAYPNGTPFQPGDIVSPSVVRPVFDRLELSKFLNFDHLKAALTVVERNAEIETLQREYAVTLANAKLTQAEREELEKEYTAKRAAARTGEYVIQLASGAGGQLPRTVAQGLLPAILEAWASEAQNVKGAWLYDVAVPGQGLLNDSDLKNEDYLVVVDLLRLTLKRVDEALEALSAIPGASLVRVPGERGLSIVEARARLQDLQQFKIEPLFAQVYGQGVFRDRGATTRYLEHRLFRLELDTKALAEKGAALDAILERNNRVTRASAGSSLPSSGDGQRAVVIPQFGDSFMDRLMEVGAQTADVKFRRQLSKDAVKLRNEMIDLDIEKNLYQALLKGFSAVEEIAESAGIESADSPTAKQRALVREAIEKRFADVTADVRFLIDQLQGLHQVISSQNLQPQNIYAVTGPTQISRSNTLNLRMMVGILGGFFILGCGIAVFVAWQRERHRLVAGHVAG